MTNDEKNTIVGEAKRELDLAQTHLEFLCRKLDKYRRALGQACERLDQDLGEEAAPLMPQGHFPSIPTNEEIAELRSEIAKASGTVTQRMGALMRLGIGRP